MSPRPFAVLFILLHVVTVLFDWPAQSQSLFYAISNFYLSHWLCINNIFETNTTTCTCTKGAKIIKQLQKQKWENECFQWYARLEHPVQSLLFGRDIYKTKCLLLITS